MLVQRVQRRTLQTEDAVNRWKTKEVDHAVVWSLLLLQAPSMMVVFPLVLLVR